MKPDWNKSPSWAEAVIASAEGVLVWVPYVGGICVGEQVEAGCRQHVDMQAPHSWKFIELRPNRTPWTGEGLPPTGTVCERNIARQAWCSTEIVAVAREGDAVAFEDASGQKGWSSCSSSFRPIRTPEQIAAEEREFSIIEIERVAMSGGSAKTMAEAIHDAGYRKFEITNEDREALAKEMFCIINGNMGDEGWERVPKSRREDFMRAIDAGWAKVSRA